MFNAIDHKIVRLKTSTGIEITLLPDGKLLIHTGTLISEKNRAKKEKENSNIQSIDELVQKIGINIPVSIVINGMGVLVKKTDEGFTENNMLSSILPNVNPSDFYYQLTGSKPNTFISIARKETVHSLLDQLAAKGFKILQFTLGFAPIHNIVPFWKPENKQPLETGLFSLQTDNQLQLTGFLQKAEPTTDRFSLTEFQVANQYVHGSTLLAFSAALSLIADDLTKPAPIESETIKLARKEYRNYKYFKIAGWTVLTSILLILLINFLFFNYYFEHNKELQAFQLVSQEQIIQHKKAQLQLKNKELFLEKSGWLKKGKFSFYADRIASLTPANTTLTSLAVFPVKGMAVSDYGAFQNRRDTIQVNGICNDPVELNQYINNLKLINEFREVSIRDYHIKKEDETGIFFIEILTR